MLLTLMGLVATAYLALLGALWWGQERLLFVPESLPASHSFDFGPDVHEVDIARPDGTRLHALHLRLPAPRGVVFYLHGNAGNLQTWFGHADFYRQAGYDLFMLDYRGYGKSGGRISSEVELRDDARAAWQQIASQYAGKTRVIAGRSLGTGLAAGLAAEVRPELTVLISPYRSMTALAAQHYPWVPGALLRYPLDTEALAPQLTGPSLLLHGDQDTLIPSAHSEALREKLPQARYVTVAGAGHGDVQEFPAYLQAVREALDAAAR
ncbi:alpha/beta fold hydrolase [Roseateles asaccharophilus]|uniref:Pimeloyl-ACP methyl ester carboxylesterase n=1 Tax=Roseateles asaccharophilus TaxID=582607 RepID=A0ABU2A611_9BURK|nr:alpha/beta fold hydrolase [Roseateles asaccharophilus]MDR7332629.1 pimeloyl-ACP methyl ester carboxylesterase [Roseateles asaccharophilus]